MTIQPTTYGSKSLFLRVLSHFKRKSGYMPLNMTYGLEMELNRLGMLRWTMKLQYSYWTTSQDFTTAAT